jgi:hypothetical protein
MLIQYRYILEGTYQAERPFIWAENAHLDIAFSCVTLLNSCTALLSLNSTEATRAAVGVQGFHGLCTYADMFWYRHVVAYSRPLASKYPKISPELLDQLRRLL